jgi:hypothetical protein
VDFFAHQADARRHSRRMVVLFTLAVLAIVAAVDALIFVVFGLASSKPDGSVQVPLQTLLLVSIAVIAVITLASMYRSASLRSGGGAVARGLHATPVPPGHQQSGMAATAQRDRGGRHSLGRAGAGHLPDGG